jgi:endo-1,4-beta-mannosidase
VSWSGRFRLGANFWSRGAGPRTWSRATDAALDGELDQARAIGLDLLRVFAFIPDFVREDGAIDESRLARMRRFAEHAGRRGISLLPTALVGHMSGDNFELPGGGDPLDDPTAAAQAEALVGALTGALEGPAIAGWALSNELPLWLRVHEGRVPDERRLLAWIDRLIAACRARSARPIGLGDGQMHGFPNRAIAARVDFVAPHVYHADQDPLRQGLRFDHALAQAARFGKPVVFEEFGGSSTQAGDPEHAALWNEGLFAAFSRGAHAALGWCWSDFDPDTLGLEDPYRHQAFELGFGLTRADGSDKPACAVLRAWRAMLDGLPDAPPRPPAAMAAFVRASYLDRSYPFSWFDRGLAERCELTAFSIAQQAGLQPAICDEETLADAPLLLVPSTQRLLTPTWLALEARARARPCTGPSTAATTSSTRARGARSSSVSPAAATACATAASICPATRCASTGSWPHCRRCRPAPGPPRRCCRSSLVPACRYWRAATTGGRSSSSMRSAAVA